jgi:hypothetical protein
MILQLQTLTLLVACENTSPSPPHTLQSGFGFINLGGFLGK